MNIYMKLISDSKRYFKFQHLKDTENELSASELGSFSDFEEAYHQLMIELVALQTKSIKLVMGKVPPQNIFVDGGFAGNDIFIQLLIKAFKDIRVHVASKPLGSSLGALLVMDQNEATTGLLRAKYNLKPVQEKV